jgi:hypothetical protein
MNSSTDPRSRFRWFDIVLIVFAVFMMWNFARVHRQIATDLIPFLEQSHVTLPRIAEFIFHPGCLLGVELVLALLLAFGIRCYVRGAPQQGIRFTVATIAIAYAAGWGIGLGMQAMANASSPASEVSP